jgi:ERCC4-type nuclease
VPRPEALVKPTILVDDREQAPLRFSAAVDVEIVRLPVGDYSLRGASDIVAIERKRLGELATCCGTERERFIEQIERLRPYPVRALVIEAELDGILSRAYRSEIHPLSVVGTLIKFMVDWQVPVVFCGDPKNTALIVERTMLRVAKQRAAEAA